MPTIEQLVEMSGCLLGSSEYHFVGARGMHLERYCDPGQLVRSRQLLNVASQRLAEIYSNADVDVVVAVSPLDRSLAELIAAQLIVMGRGHVVAQDLDSVVRSVGCGNVLVVKAFCDETDSTRAKVATLPIDRVVGACVIVATHAVAAAHLGAQKLAVLHWLGGARYDTWSCMRAGFCSRGVPIVLGVGAGDEYVRIYPNSKTVKLPATGEGAAGATVGA